MPLYHRDVRPSVRYSALAVALLTVACLIWVVAVAFVGPDRRVMPTNGVISAAGEDNPAAGETRRQLDARAALQGWRGERPEEAGAAGEARETVRDTRRTELGAAAPADVVAAWNASRETDQPILVQEDFTAGVTTLPGPAKGVFVQPKGRDWRRRHNASLTYGGGVLMFGVLCALALFLFARGRIRVREGLSGETVERFSALERANHWMTAAAFVVAGLTGLVLLYGRYLVRPWLGPRVYDDVAATSAWLHMVFIVPFVIGLVVMIALWTWGNLPSRLDWVWLKRFGGFLDDEGEHPPARRFNAGQKLIFWAVVLGGLALLATGLGLMFPFFALGYDGTQWVQLAHAAIGLIMIAVIFGHIYIGTIGMQGAIDAMWSGKVDRNWAKEHHSIWYRQLTGGKEPAE